MTITLPDDFIDNLKTLATKKQWIEGDDYNSKGDISGDDYDNAYYGGLNDGRIELANEILQYLPKE